MKTKAFWVVIFLVLLGSNLLFALMYFQATKELEGVKAVASSQHYNDLDINFLKLFIKQVIKSNKEVDFDTRLKLENSIRDLKDPELLAQWQKFVGSQNEVDAQTNVKDLLEMLVNKIYIKS